jgi:hypothetical protein
MKRKRTNWSKVPWTPFEPCKIPDADDPSVVLDKRPAAIFRNSRYQVTVYIREEVQPFGTVAHLSFKVHDKQAHHDWRDMQRIKNEICGPECDAVEVFPAESKLVDAANQYHLFVFQEFRLPFGFQTRLVGDGKWENSVQRPWPRDERPADCLSADEYQATLDAALAAKGTNEPTTRRTVSGTEPGDRACPANTRGAD